MPKTSIMKIHTIVLIALTPEYIYPYDMDYDNFDSRRIVSTLTPEIKNRRTLVSCVATVGFRF